MPGIQNPATILNLLKRAKTVYQKEDPDPKDKPELRHKEIVKDLQRLRQLARLKGGPDSAKLAKPFAARKRILLKKLTDHRKKINSTAEKKEDPNKAQLPAYLKALLKLTKALLALEFASATADEEADINLDRLEEGDPAALDELDAVSDADLADLEQADAAELPESEDQESPPRAPPPPPPGPVSADALRFTQRARTVKQVLDGLTAADAAEAPELLARYAKTLELAKAGQHKEALAQLANIEAEAKAVNRRAKADEGDPRSIWNDWLAESNLDLKAVMRAGGPAAKDIAAKLAEANALAAKGNFEGAIGLAMTLSEMIAAAPKAKGGVVGGVPPTAPQGNGAGAPKPDAPKPDGPTAGNGAGPDLAAWQAARSAVVNQLRAVAKVVAGSKHAEANQALVMLNALITNLTPAPATAQQVAELKRYLDTDDVITDVCKHAFDMRTPLLGALASIRF
jgi:hypothetical protein